MSRDDLLRSLAQKHSGEATRATSLIGKDEDELYQMLASSVSAAGIPTGSVDDRFRDAYDELERGPAIELGKRIFARCSRAAHEFCCSPGEEDKMLRDQMLKVIFSKDTSGVALLAGGLVAAFGLSPAIAAVVSALLVKLVVAPTAQEVCSTWGASLRSDGGGV